MMCIFSRLRASNETENKLPWSINGSRECHVTVGYLNVVYV